MKQSYIFCLLALFIQISVAQEKKEISINDFYRMMMPLDTTEVQMEDQTYRIIKLPLETMLFQNKNYTYWDEPIRPIYDDLPPIQLENEEGFYQSFYDNISIYTNPDSLLNKGILSIFLTSDMTGKIVDVLFFYQSCINVPLPALVKIEKYLKKECRLNFKITPVIEKCSYQLYDISPSKDKLPK